MNDTEAAPTVVAVAMEVAAGTEMAEAVMAGMVVPVDSAAVVDSVVVVAAAMDWVATGVAAVLARAVVY